ncbi:SARP family transcriptional regulator [Rhizocola hellebori]|uniref:SARP family transcriptional regulator n=1 Tax=Rhizocola hellebori TaxID=1392758 RepID=A0A8J3Q4R3_9ACTN|nr:BTAD domain-containing putative transcriptional regulator [Rhizocola hellebori]GIH03764.1 SARP family transcriptional regulator [Rhizocola hellebori]
MVGDWGVELSTSEVRMRLLGPVTVLADGVPRPIHGLRRNAVLAALALHPGEVVTVDRLVEIVWGDAAPRTASDTLRNHVSYLRRILDGQGDVVSRSAGYLLDLGAGSTDVEVAEWSIKHVDRCSDLYERKELLQSAIALWRGPALEGLAELAWFDGQARRLDQLLQHARQLLIDTRLDLGEHRQLLPELEALALPHPLDEHLHGQLMLALYRSGRQADALATYQRVRHALDDELGVVPSKPLQELEIAILRQSPSLATVASAAQRVVPAQLPLAITTFTGRHSELAVLDDLLAVAPMYSGPVVVALSGLAGVGKTTLAVHWAQRAAPAFPDGQLYLDLRGFHVSGSPMAPIDAVRHLLTSLAFPADQIPTQQEAQIGLYRSLVSGRKILLVLDNARDAEQIRPLLPGSGGCLVIVTSRNQLASLAITSGAHLLQLNPLSNAEAGDLIAQRVGADRVAAEPEAIQALVSPCAGLPLALAITAARASIHPHFSLSALATQLRDTGAGLGRFHGGDHDTDLRTVFSWSYNALSPQAAQLFRQLGLHPGWDISTTAAASLAAQPMDRARDLLAELADAHLITQHVPGRFGLHDLLRAFAGELAQADDSEQQRRAATHRLLDYYLHCAYAASEILGLHDVLDLAEIQPGVTLEHFGRGEEAARWCDAECQVALAAIERAAAAGFDQHVWQLARAWRWYLHRHAMWQAQITVQQLAVQAARSLRQPAPEGFALIRLAATYAHLGRLDDAHAQYQQALPLFEELNDLVRQGHVLQGTANLQIERGQIDSGLRSARRALELYEVVGHHVGQANALNTMGWGHVESGDFQQAVAHCRRALGVRPDIGTEAHIWDTLGYAYHRLGDFDQSASCYEASLVLSRKIGDRGLEARTLIRLGDSHRDAQKPDLAEHAWDQARAIRDQLDHHSTGAAG